MSIHVLQPHQTLRTVFGKIETIVRTELRRRELANDKIRVFSDSDVEELFFDEAQHFTREKWDAWAAELGVDPLEEFSPAQQYRIVRAAVAELYERFPDIKTKIDALASVRSEELERSKAIDHLDFTVEAE